MTDTLRWGILGTGNIARQFATGLNTSRRSRPCAVGSRTQAAADVFAQTYRVPAACPSYDQVLADRNVDAVYVSLPNSMHHEWAIKSLHAGKHVLCEKPFAGNAAQSQEMFDVAQRAGLVLIEAFMYRTHPLTLAVIQAVRDGAVGQVKLIRTSFCYRTTRVAGNIRFSAELAGGALMDIGCYCVNFSRLFAGEEPSAVQAVGHFHGGIDDLAAATLLFPGGIVATMSCGMTVQADNTAYVCGSEGYIEIPVPWKPPQARAVFTIARGRAPRIDSAASQAGAPPPRETRHVDAGADLYALEADAFAAVVLDGQRPFVTPEDTLGNMRVLDEMRRQIGVSC